MRWLFSLYGVLQAALAWSAVASSLEQADTNLTSRRADSFQNPVIYEDFADNDVSVRPDGLYYFSASNMHYSPGAPYPKRRHSGFYHAVPREHGTLVWIGCVGFWYTYIYAAEDVAGPWARAAVLIGQTCYYDCGLLIDDDETMYVVFGAIDVSVAQLSDDGISQAKDRTYLQRLRRG
ncbi:hypothetical protein GGR54DRAFT_640722 [Hypoxylon sp. NC1633]|nr:hypothetical protein GGR54DRAFT_640722 [Hypoxylon sp. NC1633]